MDEIHRNSVDLVVTSPPYPMIRMWDGLFSSMNHAVGDALEAHEGMEAFELMHRELDPTWLELGRLVKDGGYVCINIGDATRKLGETFRLYPSHVRISDFMSRNGFDSLPGIVWHKPSNSPNKFMGSGMLPAGAYVTLEHEYILLFRKKGRREFSGSDEKELRRSSSYFWEERNRWFTDVWNDLKGSRQTMKDKNPRERSAAFPLELPLRMIYMYSVLGDTVLDPFLGTGTTTQAAIIAGRNSVGYEYDADLSGTIRERMVGSPEISAEHIHSRVMAHRDFVSRYESRGGKFKFFNSQIQSPVKERSESFMTLYTVSSIIGGENNSEYEATYEPLSPDVTEGR